MSYWLGVEMSYWLGVAIGILCGHIWTKYYLEWRGRLKEPESGAGK